MTRTSGGKATLYVLSLLVGMVLGGVIGAEVVRRVYRDHFRRQPTASEMPVLPAAPEVTADDESIREQLEACRTSAIVRATRMVAPSVVGIVVTQLQVVRSPLYASDFFDFFLRPELMPRYRQVEKIGSGIIIEEDGLVLTNYHVVQNARTVYVNFPDGRELEGTISGTDPETDLALLRVKKGTYRAVELGNSDKLLIGEWAIAIGNPFGYFINDAHPSVTVGVISALDRNFAKSEGSFYQGMIQTDAAINPGNSGGPLLTAAGEVIGINAFIYTGSEIQRGSVGIGFAIPANRARRVVRELKKFGKRRQVWTGIKVRNLSRSLALSLGYGGTAGVVVAAVEQGSPGDKAGLREGDVIVRMGTRRIQSSADLEGFFSDYFVGDEIAVGYVRDSEMHTATLRLKEDPSNA